MRSPALAHVPCVHGSDAASTEQHLVAVAFQHKDTGRATEATLRQLPKLGAHTSLSNIENMEVCQPYCTLPSLHTLNI